MKHFALTAALAGVAILGFNAQSNALSPQGISAQQRTQSMSFGATEAVNVMIHDGQPDYVVPTGKVLHVEHLFFALETDSTHMRASFTMGNDVPGVGSQQIGPDPADGNLWTPRRPIRILGDGTARVYSLNNGAADWQDFTLIGYLTDQ